MKLNPSFEKGIKVREEKLHRSSIVEVPWNFSWNFQISTIDERCSFFSLTLIPFSKLGLSCYELSKNYKFTSYPIFCCCWNWRNLMNLQQYYVFVHLQGLGSSQLPYHLVNEINQDLCYVKILSSIFSGAVSLNKCLPLNIIILIIANIHSKWR